MSKETLDFVPPLAAEKLQNFFGVFLQFHIGVDKAARVVRRIYSLTIEGYGTEQIAAKLEADGILTPRAYWLSKGVNRPSKGKEQPPTKWNSSSVIKILSLQEYCGDILNFKTYSKSYKLKKRIENDRENWVVFKDVHTPIVERSVWEQVQEKRGKARKRKTNDGDTCMFSGLLVCADCGHNLHFHFNQGNPEIKYFNCSNYKGNRGTCSSTHYVRVDFLEQVVLGEIRRLTKFASRYEAQFAEAVMGYSQKNAVSDRQAMQRELYALQARDRELDTLFEKIYEDNAEGRVSDEWFMQLSHKYETERMELKTKISDLRQKLQDLDAMRQNKDNFLSAIRKFMEMETLTTQLLRELIDRIEVHETEWTGKNRTQRIVIHYRFVGYIELPEDKLNPLVRVETRQGVAVRYLTNCQTA